MLHEGLPLAIAELSFGRGSGVEVDSAIKLDADKRSEWERWSEKGREYLDALDSKVRLDDVIEEHATIVGDFYRWFVTRQTELHEEALDEQEELKAKRQNLQQKIRRPRRYPREKAAINMREERERLAKELEAERRYREWDRERAQKREPELESELDRGFWERVFGRRKRA